MTSIKIGLAQSNSLVWPSINHDKKIFRTYIIMIMKRNFQISVIKAQCHLNIRSGRALARAPHNRGAP